MIRIIIIIIYRYGRIGKHTIATNTRLLRAREPIIMNCYRWRFFFFFFFETKSESDNEGYVSHVTLFYLPTVIILNAVNSFDSFLSDNMSFIQNNQ